jgi:hypothetical protein
MTQILRSPEADPLAMPAGEVDTRFPRLLEGVYTLAIRSPEVNEGKSNPDARLFTFKLETTQDGRDTDGNPLYKGFKWTHRINVAPVGDRTVEDIKKDMAVFLKSAGMDKVTIRDVINNPSLVEGKLVKAKVTISKASGGFPESNNARFLPPEA